MDKFEQAMQNMAKMSVQEGRRMLQGIMERCICGQCPVKADLGLKFGFFCTRGSEKAMRYDQSFTAKK